MQVFGEGIGLVLNRWSALQTAIENEWGGRESHLIAQQLATNVLSWFTQSREPLYIDDLESILDEGMLSLNVEVEDGSVEEVAEKLMVMHEECLEGIYRSVREAIPQQPAHPRMTQIVNDDEDDEDEYDDRDENIFGDDNSANMDVDILISESNINSMNRPISGPLREVAGEADDG